METSMETESIDFRLMAEGCGLVCTSPASSVGGCGCFLGCLEEMKLRACSSGIWVSMICFLALLLWLIMFRGNFHPALNEVFVGQPWGQQRGQQKKHTEPNSSGPNDSNSNTGAVTIVGGVVGGAALLVIAIIAIIILLYYCYVHKNRGECVINKPPTNGASSLRNSVDATPVGTANGIANSNDVELDTDRQRCSQIVPELLKCVPTKLLNAISESHPTIQTNIKLEELYQYFDEYHIFTTDEKEYLTSAVKSKYEKVNYLIETLKSKDENGVFDFVKALDDANKLSGHRAILTKLHDKIFVTTV